MLANRLYTGGWLPNPAVHRGLGIASPKLQDRVTRSVGGDAAPMQPSRTARTGASLSGRVTVGKKERP